MSSKITSEQARMFANLVWDLAVATGNYRFDHWKQMTPAQRNELERSVGMLSQLSTSLTTIAVGLTIDETEYSLKQVERITRRAKALIGKLDEIRKTLRVVAAVVNLASAVLTRDIGAIRASVTALKTTVEENQPA